VGGGPFDAARLARIIDQLRSRLMPGQCPGPERPTEAHWIRHPNVPMSKITERRLICLAQEASNSGCKVSAMKLAAEILENAGARMPDEQHP
jgi:hypothetical protein